MYISHTGDYSGPQQINLFSHPKRELARNKFNDNKDSDETYSMATV